MTSIVNGNGTKTKEYKYDAFGNVEEPYLTDTNPWQYCGEYRDEESGLIYLRNRYYDSSTGRFINDDSIRSGINWYSYCGGNPVMFVDPLGLKSVMGGYIAEKNGGSAKATYDKKGYTSSVTISINDKTKTYTVASGDVKVINDRAVIDNEILMKDFGLSEEESLHQEGDKFNNEADAVEAFLLMYYDTSMSEQQEYGANIRKTVFGKYYFDDVNNSVNTYNKSLNELADYERNSVGINSHTNTVAYVHIHWKVKNEYQNDFTTPNDYANKNKCNIYLATKTGEVKFSKYDVKNATKPYGYVNSIVLFNLK